MTISCNPTIKTSQYSSKPCLFPSFIKTAPHTIFHGPRRRPYRLYGFSLYRMHPPVLQLTVYLPGMHMVAYNDRDDLRNVINCEQSQKSMLTEYFRMNSVNPFVHSFLYREFPEYYRWDRTKKEWLQRKQRTQIGRIVYVCPAEGERYYLRVLLNHVRAATSFNDLKPTGTALTSFHVFSPNISSCMWWYVTKTLYGLCMIISFYIVYFWIHFDMFHLFCCYYLTSLSMITFSGGRTCHVPRGM
jgi:hypothetical protein